MRDKLTTAAEVAGAVSVTIGAALMWTPLGFIVGGALALAGGWLAADQ